MSGNLAANGRAAQIVPPQATLTTGQERICPKLAENVSSWPLFQHRDSGKDVYIVGNREVDRYISVPGPKLPVVLKILAFFDGRHSLESIQDHFYKEERKRVDVLALYRQLYENGLLAYPAVAQAKGDIERMSVRLFTLPVQKLFDRMRSFSGLLLPWFTVAMLIVIAAGSEQAIAHREMLLAPGRSSWSDSIRGSDVLFYPLLVFLSFIFHEIAHGFAASSYGIVAKRFEAALYLGFIPILYLRIPGLYTLRPLDRIKVWCAGIYWNLAFASFSILLLQWVAMPPPWRRAWLLIAVANYFLALTNLFPFLPTDGYFILSTLFKTHNVRSNAWRELRNWIGARKYNFSWILLAYLSGSLAIIGLILWRDISWLHHLQRKGSFLQLLGLVLLIVPWLLLMWRWLWRRKVAGRSRPVQQELPSGR